MAERPSAPPGRTESRRRNAIARLRCTTLLPLPMTLYAALFALTPLAGLATAPVAQAQKGGLAETRQSYHIPPGRLGDALNQFAREAGLLLSFAPELVEGKSTAGLAGTYSVREGLTRLLAGSGLNYRFTAADSVALERTPMRQGKGPARLGPITVTGEKTVRRLQDTASSVSVMTDEDIEETPGATTFRDIARQLPNVQELGTGNFAPTIRGVDSTGPANGVFAFLAGSRPRVTIQQDGRPLTFNELIYGRSGLWDVDRVEVFRGPQTTLQGRNSIAGAIVIDTKDPTFEYELGGRAFLANYDTRQFSGVLSGPLIEDQLAFRLSVDRRDHESFVDLTQSSFVNNPKEEEGTNVRAKLLLLPNALPKLTAKLTFNHTATRRPQTELVSRPFRNRELDNSTPGFFPIFENKANSGILNLDYALTPDIEVRNTTTYSKIAVARLTDPGSGIVDIDADQFTNELLLEYGAPGQRLHGILGSYYFTADSDEEIDIGGGVFDDQTETIAFFGEGTITFFDKLDLTFGARYERESRERFGSAGAFNVNLDKTFSAFLPKFSLAYRPDDWLTYGVSVQRGWNAGGAGIAFVPPFPSFTYDDESVWNYELFFRSSWLDDRLTINGNLFYADYEDQQRLGFLIPDNPNSGVIRNADSTESYGAELTATFLPVRSLELFGSLGLLQTEIKKFSASVEDLTGKEFARAPDMTLSFGARYHHASGLSAGFNGRYVGGYFSRDTNDRPGKVDPYFLLNAQVGYEIRNVRFFAFATNLLNNNYKLLQFSENAQLVDPREFGGGLEVKF